MTRSKSPSTLQNPSSTNCPLSLPENLPADVHSGTVHVPTRYTLCSVLPSVGPSGFPKLLYTPLSSPRRLTCKHGPWYNKSIYLKLHGPFFEYLFVTAHQYRYVLMCVMKADGKVHGHFMNQRSLMVDEQFKIIQQQIISIQ